MSKALPIRALTTTLLALVSLAAQAQAYNDQGEAAPQAITSAIPPAAASADPHAGHAASASGATAAPAMDHSNMQMQGGSAPPDARDPHGYSDGLKLGSGDYAVPGVSRLQLADEHPFASLRAETLERRFAHKGDDSTAYDLQAWYGTTYNKAVVKAEGEFAKGELEESRTEFLWGHAVAPYWDMQLGLRVDNGEGPSRQWLAFGIQGLVPYWFELETTGYVGNDGRSALRIEGSYELLLTQRLILEPRAELHFYGKDDPERRIGKGLAEASAGLRLRYEISRQFAPYIGVERASSYGHTADYLRAEGDHTQQTRWVAGVRLWF